MQWYLKVLRQYADFGARARRTEFWMFTLFSAIISIVLLIIDNAAGLTFGERAMTSGVLGTIYSLAVLIPTLAVSVRRLHDTGRTGWWILIGLIPLIGAIVLIVWYCTDGKPGHNQWGPNPKTLQAPSTGGAPAPNSW
jgi:uncharacterized membrane protein YhaH (DUF805 family)